MKQNLHFINDSPYANWYVDKCIANSPATVNNRFLCFAVNPVYIKHEQIELFVHDQENMDRLLNEINGDRYKTVYINFLEYWQASLINKITSLKVSVVWVVWSADLYEIAKLNIKKLDTFAARHTRAPLKVRLKDLYQSVRYLYSFPRVLNRAKLSAIGRINYCATTVEPEITLIRQKLNKNIQWLPFSMLDAEEMIPDNDRERLKSPDKSAILVGNSSDPRNNHYEILQTLKEKQVKNKIICPLSYGDDAYAGKLLKSVETWYQPGQLVAITKFIPRNEYYQLLDKVGIAIMGHNVQQAFGNIIGLLCMGAKLYLKKQNFLYPLFLSWGVTVFHMEQLNNKDAFEKLDQKTAERNREIITTRYSKATVDRLYADFLSV